MRRRQFICLIGSAIAAWPVLAHAQQAAMPVIGFLGSTTADANTSRIVAFRQGLAQVGYIEGRNVAIEYRWADGKYDRLPEMASELAHREVALIIAQSTHAALAAKAATTTIPIVFEIGADPVAFGLVANLSRPDGNLTGIATLNVELAAKRLELLHELIPTATIVGLLVNPTGPLGETLSKDVQAASDKLGLQLHVLRASAEGRLRQGIFDFAQIARRRARHWY